MNIDIDLLVQCKLWKNENDINKKLMEKIFQLVFNYLKLSTNNNNSIELSITLTDDENIQSLNKEYRHRDKPTNVLTFSLYENKKSIVNDLKTYHVWHWVILFFHTIQ